MTESEEWLQLIKNSEKTAVVRNNLKKIHFKLPDGREMVEEYNLDTNVLSRRAWKSNNSIYKTVKWEVEVGDPLSDINEEHVESIDIKESKNSPYVVHRITKLKLEWRIRNLPYDLNVYQVTVDSEDACIIVRTANKKYFKKIPMLELQRLHLKPNNEHLKFTHSCNTLIISYEKPPELIRFEKLVEAELKTVQVIDNVDNCKQS